MIHSILKDKPTKLFIAITAFFVANALIAECIGGKLFSLEKLLNIQPADITLFGQSGLSFTLTCGVLLWPLEFVITDVVNDYGKQHLVSICDTADEFVQECEQILRSGSSKEWMTIVDNHLADNSWDNTWSKMRAIITETLEEKKVPLFKVVGPSI